MSSLPVDRQRKRLFGLLVCVAMAGLAVLLSMVGLAPGAPPSMGVVSFLYMVIVAGGLSAAYLCAGLGFGGVLVRVLMGPAAAGQAEGSPTNGSGGSSDRVWLALALGPGALLFVSHGLGVLGLLSGGRGFAVSWGVVVVGIAMLAVPIARGLRRAPNLPAWPRGAMLWVLPVALLLIASVNPPGALWASEARGFDALSYHLQLPQEWARGGGGERLWPLKHNVYSFLPSYFEAGFLHLSAMTGGGSARPGMGATGLIGGDGAGACACQLLHAMMAVITGLLVGRVVWRVLRERMADRLSSPLAMEAGAIAGAVAISVPWVLVVSSLAYNESAVNALGVGALLAAITPGVSPLRRGVLAGVLVGAAVGCKPTAAFFFAPLVGAALLVHVPVRSWVPVTLGAVVAGAVMIGPFLARNFVASGNPVFPAGTAMFGRGHWTVEPDQVARFAAAHTERASLGARVGLLVATTGDGLPTVDGQPGQPRGIFHEQWSVVFPVGALALVCGLLSARLRPVAVVLTVGVGAGLSWWLLASHCQARFLMPLLVSASVAVGLLAGAALAWLSAADEPRPGVGAARLTVGATALCALLLSAHTARLFLFQNRVQLDTGGFVSLPNLFLIDGLGARTGDRVRAEFATASAARRAEMLANELSPAAACNLLVVPGSRVYLLGDSTALFFSCDVVYHTTYDESPLGREVRAFPQDPESWTRALRARGVDYVLANYSELTRLSASGWYDPSVTPEVAGRWLAEWGEVIKSWDGSGVVLYRLRTPAPARDRAVQGAADDAAPLAVAR